MEGLRLERDQFLRAYNFTVEQFHSTGLEWSALEQIYEHHNAAAPDLEAASLYISNLLRRVPAVHSLKIRIKDAEHLIEKIIRKKLKNPELVFNIESYEDRITDLIGIRALHLFKDEWQAIHKFVTEHWTLRETPIAYLRNGDSGAVEKSFADARCQVKEHPMGYRSVHYLIESKPAKCVHLVELQVRTIFEEGWSEIDHLVRYPRESSDPRLNDVLTIFNRLAGNADEMGTFTKTLREHLVDQADKEEERERGTKEREEALKKAVSELRISAAEKEQLKHQIAELRKSLDPTIGSSSLLNPAYPSLFANVSLQSNYLANFVLNQKCSVCGKLYAPVGIAALELDKCPACQLKSSGFGGSLSS